MTTYTNDTIHALLDDFCNKKSRKVTFAKQELMYCLDTCDLDMQKVILRAFFSSSKTDRIWAYKYLFYHWDNSYKKEIQNQWNTYHDYECSWLIIHFFKEEYLIAHFKELNVGSNYYFLCKRLLHNEKFTIHKELLSTDEYLRLASLYQLEITDEEAMKILIEGLCHICFDKSLPDTYPTKRGLPLSPLRYKGMYFKYSRLRQLNKLDICVKFKNWDKQITKGFSKQSDFMELNDSDLKGLNYYEVRGIIWRKYLKDKLQDVMKINDDFRKMFSSQILKQLVDQKPTLKNLISTLSLEMIAFQ